VLPTLPTNSAQGGKVSGGQSNWISPTAVCVLPAMSSLRLSFYRSGLDFDLDGVSIVTLLDCTELFSELR